MPVSVEDDATPQAALGRNISQAEGPSSPGTLDQPCPMSLNLILLICCATRTRDSREGPSTGGATRGHAPKHRTPLVSLVTAQHQASARGTARPPFRNRGRRGGTRTRGRISHAIWHTKRNERNASRYISEQNQFISLKTQMPSAHIADCEAPIADFNERW